jgi:hypothetical protein
MGRLAAGIQGQANGHRTSIFESYVVPGGQAATRTRQGYSFDGYIDHLFGCRPGSRLYELWHEPGVMPRDLVPTQGVRCRHWDVRAVVKEYYDPDRLRGRSMGFVRVIGRRMQRKPEQPVVEGGRGIRQGGCDDSECSFRRTPSRPGHRL